MFNPCLENISEGLLHKLPHTKVSLLQENRKVVFTEIAGGHALSKCPKEKHSPPWNIKFQFVFRGVTASL
jgi:hypothetical protein